MNNFDLSRTSVRITSFGQVNQFQYRAHKVLLILVGLNVECTGLS